MMKSEIFERIREILVDTFELDSDDITMESHLFSDLDLDSIDAVDLVVKLQEYTDRKIDPTVFKSVRTVSDVVDAVDDILEGAVAAE